MQETITTKLACGLGQLAVILSCHKICYVIAHQKASRLSILVDVLSVNLLWFSMVVVRDLMRKPNGAIGLSIVDDVHLLFAGLSLQFSFVGVFWIFALFDLADDWLRPLYLSTAMVWSLGSASFLYLLALSAKEESRNPGYTIADWVGLTMTDIALIKGSTAMTQLLAVIIGHYLERLLRPEENSIPELFMVLAMMLCLDMRSLPLVEFDSADNIERNMIQRAVRCLMAISLSLIYKFIRVYWRVQSLPVRSLPEVLPPVTALPGLTDDCDNAQERKQDARE